MVHYLRLALKLNFIEYVELMDYPHVAGEAIMWWIVLVVGAHPVPPIVRVAWNCRPHQSARSATQAHLNMHAFGHRHFILPRWWRRELHRKIRNGVSSSLFLPLSSLLSYYAAPVERKGVGGL